MSMEWQVSSLELSRKLKELGVKQESAFYWCDNNHGSWELEDLPLPENEKDWVSAFTVAELGEILRFKIGNDHDYTSQPVEDENNKGSFQWQAWNEEDGLYGNDGNYILADTEADARAKMLIHLIEKGIINAKAI